MRFNARLGLALAGLLFVSSVSVHAATTGVAVGVDDAFWGTSIGTALSNQDATVGKWVGYIDMATAQAWATTPSSFRGIAIMGVQSTNWGMNGNFPLQQNNLGEPYLEFTVDDGLGGTTVIQAQNGWQQDAAIIKYSAKTYNQNASSTWAGTVGNGVGGPNLVMYKFTLPGTLTGKTLTDDVKFVARTNWSDPNITGHVYACPDDWNQTTVTYGNYVTINPPATPAGFTATPISNTVIDLAWTDGIEELNYVLERSLNGIDYTVIATKPKDAVSHQDANLTQNTLYYYRLSAQNKRGNSTVPAAASATTLDVPPVPPQPTDLTATPINATNVYVQWTDASALESAYEVEYSTDGNNFTVAGVNATDDVDRIILGLTPDTLYTVRVRATNYGGAQQSAWATTTVSTMATNPHIPAAHEDWAMFDVGDRPSDPFKWPLQTMEPERTGIRQWTGENVWSANYIRVDDLGFMGLATNGGKKLECGTGLQRSLGFLDESVTGLFRGQLNPDGQIGGTGSELFLSFTYQIINYSATGNTAAYVALGDVDDAWVPGVGKPNINDSFWFGQFRGDPNFYAGPNPTSSYTMVGGMNLVAAGDGNPHFVVVRVQFADGPDTYSVYFDPDPAAGMPGTPTVQYTVDGIIEAFCWETDTAPYPINVDEIRMGDAWSKVTPTANANAADKITAVNMLGGLDAALTVGTVVGNTYQVQENPVSPDPDDPNWVDVGTPVNGNGDSLSMPVTLPNTGGKFYNVQIVSP